jgi:aminoglycoside phosphotransferase (APT) family kinase protein
MSAALSTSTCLDVPAASRLAERDPALSLLPAAVASAEASGRVLHDVGWTPGTGCRLAYRAADTTSEPTFVAVVVSGDSWTEWDYREDAELSGLRSATAPDVLLSTLPAVLRAPVHRCTVQPVRYRPGSRCVVRYDVTTDAGTTALFAKSLRADEFDQVRRNITALAGAAPGPRPVPDVRAVWPRLKVVVTSAVRGRPVSAVLGDSALEDSTRAAVAHRLGRALADLHGRTDIGAPPWTSGDTVVDLVESMPAVRCADPPTADRLAELVDALAAGAPAAQLQTLGHGAFRAGQVIAAEGGELVMLDTDGLCRCDPGRDIGTALAHLTWQAIRRPAEQRAIRHAERALVLGYESRARWSVDPRAQLWWQAAGLLQIAVRRYRRLEVAHWSSVPALVEVARERLSALGPSTRRPPATNLLDCREMTPLLRRALGHAAVSPQALVVESATELGAVPGRRTVVRYTVSGLDRSGAVPVVGKAFSEPRRARLLHDHLRLLWSGPFRDGDLRTPEPLALVPEHRLVVYRHASGTPLDRISDPVLAGTGIAGAARWLARLHGSAISLPRVLSLDQEERSSKDWAALVGRTYPALAGEADRLADQWAAKARSGQSLAEVPVHKDFHPGHVLLGPEIFVVDLDEARQGDPAFDVAHFCTYLELVGEPHAGPDRRRAFLEEYAAATGWVDTGTYDAFRAYTCLKIAKQWAAGSGPCRGKSPARRASGAERALTMGAACLSA